MWLNRLPIPTTLHLFPEVSNGDPGLRTLKTGIYFTQAESLPFFFEKFKNTKRETERRKQPNLRS